VKIKQVDDWKIKGVENLDLVNYFAPQVILPEKNVDFFLIHNHYFLGTKEIQAVAIPCVGGATEKIKEIETRLTDLRKRVDYGWSGFLGFVLKRFYPIFQPVMKEASMIKGSQDEKRIKTTQMIQSKMRKPETILKLLNELPLPFIQLLQPSLAGYVSQFVLEKSKKMHEGLGITPTKDTFNRLDEMLLSLYKSGIVYPVVSTTTCTNTLQPHYDFTLSSFPVHRGTCRICDQPLITFNIYLVTEPYSSLKIKQQDLSYVVAAYLNNRGDGQIECFPEVFVKKNSKEEQVDIFVRNWTTGETAVIECKVKENPKTTFDTKVNIIHRDLSQLQRKMKELETDFGYIISNIIFDSIEEKQKVLSEAAKGLNSKCKNKIRLKGKIAGNVISEWDSILTELKQKP